MAIRRHLPIILSRHFSSTNVVSGNWLPLTETRKLAQQPAFPEVSSLPSSHQDSIRRIFKSYDLGNQEIVEKHPWLLLIDAFDIESRLKKIQTSCLIHAVADLPFKVKINSLVFNEDIIEQLVRKYKNAGRHSMPPIVLRRVMNLDRRVAYFCEELEAKPSEITSKLDVFPNHYMIVKPLHDIKTVMKLLKEELSFTNRDILSHRRLFARRMSSLRDRIARLKSLGIPVLPHLLSSGYFLFDSMASGETSVPDLLRNQLNLSSKQVISITKANKQLLRRKSPCLSNIIELLTKEAGYSQQDIIKNPQVLTMDPDILKRRLKAIEPIGKVVSLQYLRYREHRFNQLLEEVKKSLSAEK